MTRPHLVWKPRPDRTLEYASRSSPGWDAEFLGGTILWRGLAKTGMDLALVGLPKPRTPAEVRLAKRPWIHMTLSPPPTLVLQQKEWLALMRVALEGLGLPPDRIRWIAFRHVPSLLAGATHIHALVVPLTLSGAWVPLPGIKARCDDADAALRRHLGLDVPWRDTLDIATPVQRLTSDTARHIAQTAREVLRQDQPVSLEAFHAGMVRRGDVGITLSPNARGTLSCEYIHDGEPGIRGRSISDDLTPSALQMSIGTQN